MERTFVKMVLDEILWAGCTDVEKSTVPMDLCSDAKSVMDQLQNLAPKATEKRALVDLMALREMISKKLINRFLFANSN